MSDILKTPAPAKKPKFSSALLFIYGLAAGTSPLLFARCASSGGCGNCGAACGVALGVLPLLLILALRSKWRPAFSRISAALARRRGSSD